jgi:hypothetical protein
MAPNPPSPPPAVVNRLELRVLAMRRSGHHAVLHWLLRQAAGPALFLNDVALDERGALRGNRFSRYRNLPADAEARDRAGERVAKDLLAWNLEDRGVVEMAAFCRGLSPASHGASGRVRHLIVLRDPWNWLASRFRAEPADPLDGGAALARWREQAREALGRTALLPDLRPVSFNRWVAEEGYRRELAADLGLAFDDAGFREVEWPGGSSFGSEGVRADNAVVLARYLGYAADPAFRAAFDPETVELAEAFFGWNPFPGSLW